MEQLGHPVRDIGVGGGLGEDGPLTVRDQRLLQRPQEVLDDPGEGVDIVLGQVGAAAPRQELVPQVPHLHQHGITHENVVKIQIFSIRIFL